jgi:hypothetical protein
VDDKAWINDACTWLQYRLDVVTGTWEAFEPFKVARPNIYDTMADAQNNEHLTVTGRSHIGRVDTKTGEMIEHLRLSGRCHAAAVVEASHQGKAQQRERDPSRSETSWTAVLPDPRCSAHVNAV